jgi:hypothetical protein
MVSASYRVGLLMRAALYSLAVACLCGTASASESEAVDGVTLDEIKHRLTEWRGSFVNIRAVWELRSLPETDEAVVEWPAPPDPKSGSLFSRKEWIWADHGLTLSEDWTFFYDDGTCELHNKEVFNGPKGVVFRARYQKPPGGPEGFGDLLLRGLGSGKPTSPIAATALRGLYWPGYAAWLPELLPQWNVELDGIDNVGGEPCARITARPHDTDLAFAKTLWLDLNHDCLVRRLRSPEVARRMLGSDFIVDEFQRLADGIWFPKRGRDQLGGTPHENHLFVVTEAAVNQSLDSSRFEPPAPDVGTFVDDNGKMYRHGVSAASPGQGMNTNGASQLPASHAIETPAASGAPRTSHWLRWSAALAAIAMLFLALGFSLSRRNREERS